MDAQALTRETVAAREEHVHSCDRRLAKMHVRPACTGFRHSFADNGLSGDCFAGGGRQCVGWVQGNMAAEVPVDAAFVCDKSHTNRR